MKIIAFAGMPFSGKSEAVKIAQTLGITVIRMGDMVWAEVKKRGLKLKDENVGKIANDMRDKFGKDIWAKKTIGKLKKYKDVDFIVIDGIRNTEEIDTFKKHLGKYFFLIAIDVPDIVRHKRGLSREREDDSRDLEKIKDRDIRELRWGLGSVIKSADLVINNDGDSDIDDVIAHIDHIVNLVGIDHVAIGSDFDGTGGNLVEGLRYSL